ncbi:MAG: hypothetical protein JNJ69_08690 [Leptospiraceae bacterium]|nr:hypothetical protein [Leptospiraceae bacterium]
MRLSVFVLCVIISGGISAETLVNRRVLLVNFVNQNKASSAEYLSVTVPEALIGPLQKTGSFEILSRDIAINTAKRLQITDADLFTDANAVALGKATAAEVVVIGNYVVVGNTVQIQTKAIDTESGRVKASQTAIGKTDGSIFDTVNKLALAMSADMKQNLPPLPQREVIRERAVYKEGDRGPTASEKLRSSWYFGAGAGANNLIDVEKNLGFGTLRSLYAGFLGQAVWGKTLFPQLLVGAAHFVGFGSGDIWEKSFATFKTTHIDNFVTVSYFPFKTGFNLRGGIGVTWLNYGPGDSGGNTPVQSGSHFGPGALLQTGYSFWLGENFNLGINLGFIAGSSEKDPANRLLLFVTAEWF